MASRVKNVFCTKRELFNFQEDIKKDNDKMTYNQEELQVAKLIS